MTEAVGVGVLWCVHRCSSALIALTCLPGTDLAGGGGASSDVFLSM